MKRDSNEAARTRPGGGIGNKLRGTSKRKSGRLFHREKFPTYRMSPFQLSVNEGGKNKKELGN